jgi:N-acetylglutamate synthase-like GNAT family acetyltransferase
MIFEKTKIEDISEINELSPDKWGNIGPKIELYLKMDFCNSIKLVDNDKIIGIGTTIFYKDTSWIAHLIVKNNSRNKGYGTKILNYLCDHCKDNGYKTILLFATEMGYPLYKKYGFELQTEYIQYEKLDEKEYFPNRNIRSIQTNDYEKILELDRTVTGENRKDLLLQYISNGFVYTQNNEIIGYYLNNLGEGLIIAINEEAGHELMKLRISNGKYATVPIGNMHGNIFYKENGFKEIMKIKRMVYGSKIECKNENIYNRIGGNFG